MSIPDEKLARWTALPRRPGPWVQEQHEDGDDEVGGYGVTVPGPGVHTDTTSEDFLQYDPEIQTPSVADAAFIAHAPEMREAIDELVAEVRRLRAAIETVLADDETGPGGWGPDVTMQGVLRDALNGDDAP